VSLAHGANTDPSASTKLPAPCLNESTKIDIFYSSGITWYDVLMKKVILVLLSPIAAVILFNYLLLFYQIISGGDVGKSLGVYLIFTPCFLFAVGVRKIQKLLQNSV
jgi:hypothetical protein